MLEFVLYGSLVIVFDEFLFKCEVLEIEGGVVFRVREVIFGCELLYKIVF